MGELNFTAPRFDNKPLQGLSETDIITTSGSFLLRFKFDLVKKDYKKGVQDLSVCGKGYAILTFKFPLIYKYDNMSACRFLYSANDIAIADLSGVMTVCLDEEGGDEDEQDSDEENVIAEDELEALTSAMNTKLKLSSPAREPVQLFSENKNLTNI